MMDQTYAWGMYSHFLGVSYLFTLIIASFIGHVSFRQTDLLGHKGTELYRVDC